VRDKIVLKPRKQPRQERSRQMREDILTASIRVLRREGALRFTTPRVAAAAGISVGSLYQYFPNKHALIFALHQRTVERAWIDVQRILDDRRAAARHQIRRIARLFFFAESEEVAEMGRALQDAEIFFADQPEHRAIDDLVQRRFTRFVRQALPSASAAQADFAANLLVTVLESVGRAVAARRLPPHTVGRWARACADMLADHLGLP
jgi:AcrR family transcriptional regulator